jgi:hypothetical protein
MCGKSVQWQKRGSMMWSMPCRNTIRRRPLDRLLVMPHHLKPPFRDRGGRPKERLQNDVSENPLQATISTSNLCFSQPEKAPMQPTLVLKICQLRAVRQLYNINGTSLSGLKWGAQCNGLSGLPQGLHLGPKLMSARV